MRMEEDTTCVSVKVGQEAGREKLSFQQEVTCSHRMSCPTQKLGLRTQKKLRVTTNEIKSKELRNQLGLRREVNKPRNLKSMSRKALGSKEQHKPPQANEILSKSNYFITWFSSRHI